MARSEAFQGTRFLDNDSTRRTRSLGVRRADAIRDSRVSGFGCDGPPRESRASSERKVYSVSKLTPNSRSKGDHDAKGNMGFVFGFDRIAAESGLIAKADEPQWKIGLASIKITPEEPVRMSGYAGRTQPSQGIATDLYAKTMAVQDESGNRAVLVTSDLIGFRADFAEPTCHRISEKTGLRRDQILLNSSHTHTGPTLALGEADLDFPPEQAQATVKYTRWLQIGWWNWWRKASRNLSRQSSRGARVWPRL